jgi:rubrerythrin
MIDFYKELQEHLEDECEDVVDYTELANKANDSGEAQILKDIAYEEYIHAGHLKDILQV